MKTKAVLIAGASSGSGKTTLTLGLMAALKKMGLDVCGFKSGPDYIDPSLHKIVTGKPSINLDTWMMPKEYLERSFQSRAAIADISVIEGVMGIHDGRLPDSSQGSTAELAAWLKVPVVLIVNANSIARTAAAIVNGLVDFDPTVNIIGVVFNNVGSIKHYEILEKAVSTYCSVPALGCIPKNNDIDIPSRHLGLYMGEDGILDNSKIKVLADTVSKNVDIDKILLLSEMDIKHTDLFSSSSDNLSGHKPKRIAIARDKAFCFYYEDNFEILKHLGYEIVFFSPTDDTTLPEDVDAYYFGGGYPELYAKALSENKKMRKAISEQSLKGAFIYGECGGLMYLGEFLTTVDGQSYPMCGCLPYSTAMKSGLQSLGYTEVKPLKNFLFLKQGIPIRGHCFHYSQMISNDKNLMENIYTGNPADKAQGYRLKNTLASYVHLHFSSLIEI
ncbi:MAG: cobyrinate a,c-diamide synthase [Proteobacteria bacterium]|nr:cobyrinate a,c-diamide synthase [Pseudomonadota bacterium]